ncbi:MAG: single-stranded DNA-binding protein [Alphaproteobacteria bacterium]|jgi:single-strand DNA-binding protein|nr:single-stranded DNA-binding protein [Alphaproteobacteria bacterium]
MAGSVNKVILIGNLGRDPEMRTTTSGADIVHLSIATSESWKDKDSGERKERTEWHRVVIFNEGLGKIAHQYLKKGSKVYIEGELHTRKWTDAAGQEKYSTEVTLPRFRGALTLLDGGGGGRGPSEDDYGTTTSRGTAGGTPSRTGSAGGGAASGGGYGGGPIGLDDEIPFFRPDR